jgi:deoxyribose-phosphate aldolase
MLNIDFLKENIDFTNIKPYLSYKDIDAFCELALLHQVKTIYVPPIFVTHVNIKVNKKGIDVGTVAGFPYGNIPIELKEQGIILAARAGAAWVDVCLDLSSVKSHRYDAVKAEIIQLTNTAHRRKVRIKIIVESPFLTKDELIYTVKLVDGLADYLKTASGVGNKITKKDVKIIKQFLRHSKLKVAGGIATIEQINEFFNLGADKIGTSKGFEILESLPT